MHKFNTTLTKRSDTAAQNQQENTDADRVLPTDDGTQLATTSTCGLYHEDYQTTIMIMWKVPGCNPPADWRERMSTDHAISCHQMIGQSGLTGLS